jgi:hypothetical protein
MKRVVGILVIIISTVLSAKSADHYTRGTGDFTGSSIWGNTTSGTGAFWSTLTIAAGDNIYIDDDITLNSTLNINVNVTIHLNANLTVDGQLNLTANSRIIFISTLAHILGTPPGNSDKIRIGAGNTVWSTSDGAITGPGTLDQNSSNGVLPISLLYFNVKTVSSEGVTFSWATASELNFDHFNLQRSTNGKDFEDVASIQGNGTTKETHKYEFTDKSVLTGVSYYRLQSVDFDGYTETFNVVSVNNKAEKNAVLYPVPVTNSHLAFQLNFQPIENILITITSHTGIERVREVIKTNETNIDLNLSLEPGIYIVKMASQEFSKVSTIIVK